MIMSRWLQCKVSEGMFTSEFAVKAEEYDGKGFSLFALKDELDMEDQPNGSPVPGFLRITSIKEENHLVLVALPRPCLEGGQRVTVRSNQLRNESQVA